jgi:hypothetical protein
MFGLTRFRVNKRFAVYAARGGLPWCACMDERRIPQPSRIVWLVTAAVAMLVYALLAEAMLRAIVAAAQSGMLYSEGDFRTMWRAGLLIRAGAVATLYDPQLFDDWMGRHFTAGWQDVSWLYTPPMGLVAAAVSAVPLRLGFWLWRGATILGAALLLRRAGLGWAVIAAGLAGPVELYDMLLGQNGALTGGLLVAALLMMETRPRLAGGLAGCLIIKPQIAILLPFILLRRRFWPALVVAALTSVALAVAATWLEGFQCWALFLTKAQPEAARILRIPFGQVFQMTGFTVFLLARSMGAGLAASWAAQGAVALAAAAAMWWLWSVRGADNVARMAASVCLSMLATPYGFSYDLVGFSIAMAALGARAPAWVVPLLAILWIWPGLTSLITLQTHFVLLPIAAVAGLSLALLQLRGTAAG